MLDADGEAERTLHAVQQWVLKAESDLANATHVIQLGAEGPLDTMCFHAQQCIEKYVKALLTLHAVAFPRTHDIGVLLGLLPQHLRPGLTPDEQGRLNDYRVESRYPGDYEVIPLEEAMAAVELAQRVRKEVRSHLPRAAYRAR